MKASSFVLRPSYFVLAACALAAASAHAAAPVIDSASVSVAQRPDRTVEINYTMNPAAVGDAEQGIVTVDIRTNGVSVGGANLTTLTGDVNRSVAHTADYRHKILWQPDQEGMGEISIPAAQVTAEVTVWTTNNPPAYWVLDLTHLADRTYDRYYPNVGQIPLGVTNILYKTDRLVMRRIPAKGVTWKEGYSTTVGYQTYRYTTFSYDYYIGIYEVTTHQYSKVMPSGWNAPSVTDANRVLPYRQRIGMWRGTTSGWPGNKYTQTSDLGWIRGPRERIGFRFDMPTGAEWEYACRAGSSTKYCNGDTADDLAKVAWTTSNSDGVYHEVGTKEPNAWGLYDMHGNAAEWAITRVASRSADPKWDPLGPAASEIHTSGGASNVPYCDRTDRWQSRGGAAITVAQGMQAYYESGRVEKGMTDHNDNSYGGIRLCLPIP